MLSTTNRVILAAILVSAASTVVTGCAAQAETASETDPAVGQVIQPIIGGTADGTAHDSVVVLTTFQGGERKSLCTGTLVAPNLLITARHCVSNTEGATACAQNGTAVTGGNTSGNRKADTLVVFTGKGGVSPDSTKEANAAARGKLVIVNSATNVCNNDIAFLLLDKDVDAPVAPIRKSGPLATEKIAAVGFGVDGTGGLTKSRMVRNVPIAGLGPAPYPNNPSWGYGDHEFMTGEAACAGDSGGPAFASTGAVLGIAARTGNGKAVVNSYADSCTGPDAHTVYTHLAGFDALINAAFGQAGHAPWLEGTPNPYTTVASTGGTGGTNSSGGVGDNGATEGVGATTTPDGKPLKDAKSGKPATPGAETPAPPPADGEDEGGGGGCSMSSGDTPKDNVMYAAGLVAIIAFAFGLRRRFRKDDGPAELPPSTREPYESSMHF